MVYLHYILLNYYKYAHIYTNTNTNTGIKIIHEFSCGQSQDLNGFVFTFYLN